jgi:hypothetical protein
MTAFSHDHILVCNVQYSFSIYPPPPNNLNLTHPATVGDIGLFKAIPDFRCTCINKITFTKKLRPNKIWGLLAVQNIFFLSSAA